MNKELIKQAFQLGYIAGVSQKSNSNSMEKDAGVLSHLLTALATLGVAGGGVYAYNKSPKFKNFVDNTGLKIKEYGQAAGKFTKEKWNKLLDAMRASEAAPAAAPAASTEAPKLK